MYIYISYVRNQLPIVIFLPYQSGRKYHQFSLISENTDKMEKSCTQTDLYFSMIADLV